MTQFDDRERAFETRFAMDQELRFRATARRNRLFGQWAAERLGRADVEAYAKDVVRADFAEPGDDDVLRKVKGDFDAAGLGIGEAEIRAKMKELLHTAAEQLSS